MWVKYKKNGNQYRIWEKSETEFVLFFDKVKSVYSSDGWHSESEQINKGVFTSIDKCKEEILRIEHLPKVAKPENVNNPYCN